MQRIKNKAKGSLDAMPDYYSFHVITGQVEETMKVGHVRTLSVYLARKDRGAKCKYKKGQWKQNKLWWLTINEIYANGE